MAGDVKLGQPVPESNFVSDANKAAPQAAQWYIPSSWLWTYLPVNAGSVPLRRNTSYCSGVNSSRHSASVFSIGCAIDLQPTIDSHAHHIARGRHVRLRGGLGMAHPSRRCVP